MNKRAFLTLLFFVTLATFMLCSNAAKSWQVAKTGVVCAPVAEALKEFKSKGFQPRVLGANDNLAIVVWLNKKMEMVVTNTMKVEEGPVISCITGVGKEGSEILEESSNELKTD